MEYETINKETPEMKQLISGIQEVSRRIREIAQTHRPLFGEKSTLRGERFANGFLSALAPCKTIGTRGLFPTLKSQGKYSTNSPTSTDYCKRIITHKSFVCAFDKKNSLIADIIVLFVPVTFVLILDVCSTQKRRLIRL